MGWSNAGWRSSDGGWYKNAAAGGGATTTLDPANTTAGFTLSGGNLIATQGSAANSQFSRSVASHTTGAYYYSVVHTFASTNNNGMGILDGSQGVATSNFLGDSVHSVGIYPSGHVFINNAQAGAGQAYVTGDTIDVAVDLASLKMWFRVNGGNWNNDVIGNQNPAIGSQVGGISFSGISTPIFAAVSSDINASVFTMNLGASAYSNAAPSGYSNW